MDDDMRHAAYRGYISGEQSPHILTSPMDMAWRAGAYCHAQGFFPPTDCRMGRGYKVRVQCANVEVILDFAKDSKTPQRIDA